MPDHEFSCFRRYGGVGVAPPHFIKRRDEAISIGAYTPPVDDPVVWLGSKEEFERILRNTLHPKHDMVRRAASGQEWKKPKTEQRIDEIKEFTFVDRANCVHRLILLLEEMAKPDHDQRHPFVRNIVQSGTRFDMRLVYSGRLDRNDRWNVSAIHPIGLAALDKWFLDYGLCPSIITKPGEADTLDVSGVVVMTRKYVWKRRHLFDHTGAPRGVFGIKPADWQDICDIKAYSGYTVTPKMVLDRLRFATLETHSPHFNGAALPD